MRILLLVASVVMGLTCGTRLPLPKGVTWDQVTGKFDWRGGNVILPVGFYYEVLQGADSYVGQFAGPNGKVVIRHDIGGYAGAWARARRDGGFFEEWDVQGSRVWFGLEPWGRTGEDAPKLLAVTFPDASCASFFIESAKPEDFEWILQLARSFRPKQPVKRSDDCR